MTREKGLYKKLPLWWLFTDFKHHAKSWKNSKKMRAKRERQMLKKEGEQYDTTEGEGNSKEAN